MQIAVIVVSIFLVIFMAVAGFLNVFFVGDAKINQVHLGISVAQTRFIGWCQWAAVVGLIAGSFWRPLGIATAIALIVLLILAVNAHRRVGDGLKEMVQAIVCLVASVFVLVGHVVLLGQPVLG